MRFQQLNREGKSFSSLVFCWFVGFEEAFLGFYFLTPASQTAELWEQL